MPEPIIEATVNDLTAECTAERTHPTWRVCFAGSLVVFPVYKIFDLAFDCPLIQDMSDGPPFAVLGCWFPGFTFLGEAATSGAASSLRHGLGLWGFEICAEKSQRCRSKDRAGNVRNLGSSRSSESVAALQGGCIKSGMKRAVAALVRRPQITCCGR